jgi:hypothetical protein
MKRVLLYSKLAQEGMAWMGAVKGFKFKNRERAIKEVVGCIKK